MKRLIPKMQTAWGTMPRDATYVASPYVEERIPYTPKQGEQIIRVQGKPVVVKHEPTYVSTPSSTKMTSTEKDVARRQAEKEVNDRKMAEGEKKADAFLKLTMPHTYIAPFFLEGDYMDNFGKGIGTWNGDLALDMITFSLPSTVKPLFGRTAMKASKVVSDQAIAQAISDQDEINTFLVNQLGKNLKIGEMGENQNFMFYRYDPTQVAIVHSKGGVEKYLSFLKREHGIQPKNRLALVIPSRNFAPDVAGRYNPSTEMILLNPTYSESLNTTYIHEGAGHATEKQAFGTRLGDTKFPESDYVLNTTMLRNMSSSTNLTWQDFVNNVKHQTDNAYKYRLSTGDNVEDLYRNTIRQLQDYTSGATIRTSDIGDPSEFRAVTKEAQANLYKAAGYDKDKMYEMIDEMPNLMQLFQYYPQESAYTTQLYDIVLDAALNYNYDKAVLFNRFKNILKYAPAVVPVTGATVGYLNNDNNEDNTE